MLLLLLLLLLAGGGAAYTQKEYVLSGYLDPPLNDASYAALADANFTGVFGDRTCVYAGGNAKMCSANGVLQASLCAKHNLTSCYPGFSSAKAVPLGGSVDGYYLRDEPHANEFKALAETVAGVHKQSPGALVFINLLGGYMASPAAAMGWWGFPQYHEYVDAFVKAVRPDILCFDLYPSFGISEFTLKMMNFALKMMKFPLKMENYAFKLLIFSFQMMNFVFKMMIVGRRLRLGGARWRCQRELCAF